MYQRNISPVDLQNLSKTSDEFQSSRKYIGGDVSPADFFVQANKFKESLQMSGGRQSRWQDPEQDNSDFFGSLQGLIGEKERVFAEL